MIFVLVCLCMIKACLFRHSIKQKITAYKTGSFSEEYIALLWSFSLWYKNRDLSMNLNSYSLSFCFTSYSYFEDAVYGFGQLRGALVFSLICAWINGWVNNGEAADLRRHRAHYDVTLMTVVHLLLHIDSRLQAANEDVIQTSVYLR